MLQRIQSVWLFLAAAFDATTFRFPFYNGDWMKDSSPSDIALNASTTSPLTILSILAGVLALVNIFLFKNRKLQLRLCFLGILVTIVLLGLYALEIGNFYRGNLALWAIFYFAILIAYLLAARGIKNDEKLIRSMDRLR